MAKKKTVKTPNKNDNENLSEVAIDIKNVSFSIGNSNIINNLSLKIFKGETFVIVGQSGAGKTTLLKLCFGLLYPTGGEIIIENENIHTIDTEHRLKIMKDVGFVFQEGALIQNLSVYDNLALCSRYHCDKTEEEIADEVKELLTTFNLYNKINVRPAQLSFGEVKLVAFARELIEHPTLVFFDEPIASIDPQTVRKMFTRFLELKNNKCTQIIVSHELDFAYSIADRIGIMQDGEFIFTGTVSELKNSKNQIIQQAVENLVGIKNVE